MNRLLIPFCVLLILTTTVSATPTIHEMQTYYKITGSTAADLRAQMNTQGPSEGSGHYDALTTWHIGWQYNWHYDRPSQNPCYVTHVDITANITYLFPDWTNKSSSDPTLQTKWDTYQTNLRSHEQGHADNGKKAAAEIESALLSTPAMPSCNALKDALESRAKQLISQHNAWDIQYDKDTNHGKNQGAVFP